MKTKMYLPLLFVCLGVFFSACTPEPLHLPEEQSISDDVNPQFRANTIDKGDDCEEAGERLDCNCEYRIDYISRPQDTWRLHTYGASTKCCVNNNYVNNIDITEGCGSFTDIPLGEWRQFRCGLSPITYFNFSSAACSNINACEHPSNTIQFTVSCTNLSGGSSSEKSYFLYANTGENCENEPATTGMTLGYDCVLQ